MSAEVTRDPRATPLGRAVTALEDRIRRSVIVEPRIGLPNASIGQPFAATMPELARDAVSAALDGPKDQYDCMDDVTIAVHAAICEDSPEDCVEWRGACVKAVEAARTAIFGAQS